MDFGFLKNLFPNGAPPSFGSPAPQQQQPPTTPMPPPQMSQQPIQAAPPPDTSGMQPTQAPQDPNQQGGLLGGLHAPQFAPNKQGMQNLAKQFAPPPQAQAQANAQAPQINLQPMNLQRSNPMQFM